MVNLNTKTSIPRISISATTNYDEEYNEAIADVVRNYIIFFERPYIATETDAPIIMEFPSKCCPCDFTRN